LLICALLVKLFAAEYVRTAIKKELLYFSEDTVFIGDISITYFPPGIDISETRFDLHLPVDTLMISYKGQLGEARVKGVNLIDILQGKDWKVGLVEVQNAKIDWVVKSASNTSSVSEPSDGSMRQNVLIQKLNFNNLNLSAERGGKRIAFHSSLELDSLRLLRSDSLSWKVSDIKLVSKKGTFDELVEDYALNYDSLWYNSRVGNLELRGFEMTPNISRETFIRKTDYIKVQSKLSLKLLEIKGIDAKKLSRGLYAQQIIVDSLYAELFEDTRKPRKPGRIPLPSESLLKLPFDLAVDSLILREAGLDYYEKAKADKRLAHLKIRSINARVYPLLNVRQKLSTALDIKATAVLMDEALIKLNAQFLEGKPKHDFKVELTMGPARASIFNPAIEPIAGFGIKSGYCNRVFAAFTGDDYYASGFVKMDYEDFKVDLPEKDRGSLLASIVEGLGNFAAVNNNHDFNDKLGQIRYKRDVRRPFINYWWVATKSGIQDIIKVF
jgi:hypothetical protein